MYKSLYKVLFEGRKNKIIYFTFLGMITGVMNTLLIVYLNILIGQLISKTYLDYSVSIFLFLFIVWGLIFSKRILTLSVTRFTQNRLYEIRSQLINVIIKSNYLEINKQKEKIHNILTRDIEIVTSAGTSFSGFISSLIFTVSCLIYIETLSSKLFLFTLLAILLGTAIYYLSMKKLIIVFNKVKELSDSFLLYFNHIISGFKEISVAREKGSDIKTKYLDKILHQYHSTRVKAFTSFTNLQFSVMIFFYLFIGFIILFGASTFHIESQAIISFIFVMLYVLSSIESIVVSVPALSEANISSKRLLDLKVDLQKHDLINKNSLIIPEKKIDFETLEFKNINFKYKTGDSQFGINSLSLTIKKHEINFIHGGNGSGKTSLVMCMLGIYKVDSGEIFVNGERNIDNYSSLFSPVFSDFYLFDLFYGNFNFDRKKAEYYLELFELNDKLQIVSEGFSSIKFSTGQKKRLALIQVLLEDKPILIIDEWAADQDPQFRNKFYTYILPLLKKEGRTIVAITHDDKYFAYADHLYKMDNGILTKSNKEIYA